MSLQAPCRACVGQDLVPDYGFASGHQTVKRFICSTYAHRFEHQLIPLFVLNVLDHQSEHAPAD